MKLKDEYLRENKALQAIEALCLMLGDIMDMKAAKKEELQVFAREVYKLSHSAQRRSCFNVHENWRITADKILKESEEAHIARYKNPLER